MSYLLDTNVLSETVRRSPEPAVISWLEPVPSEALFLSVLTLGEIRKGIERLRETRRRERLRIWLEHDLPDWFSGRILPVDSGVADRGLPHRCGGTADANHRQPAGCHRSTP